MTEHIEPPVSDESPVRGLNVPLLAIDDPGYGGVAELLTTTDAPESELVELPVNHRGISARGLTPCISPVDELSFVLVDNDVGTASISPNGDLNIETKTTIAVGADVAPVEMEVNIHYPDAVTVGTMDEPVEKFALGPHGEQNPEVPITVRQNQMNTLLTLTSEPFDDPRPSDLIIKVSGRNEEGWIIEASNNTTHLPACDAQLASWFIANLGFMPNNDIAVGKIYHARITPLDYQRSI